MIKLLILLIIFTFVRSNKIFYLNYLSIPNDIKQIINNV